MIVFDRLRFVPRHSNGRRMATTLRVPRFGWTGTVRRHAVVKRTSRANLPSLADRRDRDLKFERNLPISMDAAAGEG